MEEFVEQYNLQKVSYRTYIGLLILPIDIILFYNNNTSKSIIFTIIVIIIATNILTYLLSLKITKIYYLVSCFILFYIFAHLK